MSSGTRVPREIAEKVAARLVGELRDGCTRIEVAGSVRRGRESVGDIELVAIPRIEREIVQAEQRDLFGVVVKPAIVEAINHLDGALRRLLDEEMIRREPPEDERPAWGEKYKKFWCWLSNEYGWLQVDLFAALSENWGAIFTIRTGPGQFGRALMMYANARTGYKQDKGYLQEKATGRVIETPEEQDYFRELGLLWIPPSMRDRADAMSVCQGKVKVP